MLPCASACAFRLLLRRNGPSARYRRSAHSRIALGSSANCCPCLTVLGPFRTPSARISPKSRSKQDPRVRRRFIDDLAVARALQPELANMNRTVTVPPQEFDGEIPASARNRITSLREWDRSGLHATAAAHANAWRTSSSSSSGCSATICAGRHAIWLPCYSNDMRDGNAQSAQRGEKSVPRQVHGGSRGIPRARFSPLPRRAPGRIGTSAGFAFEELPGVARSKRPSQLRVAYNASR